MSHESKTTYPTATIPAVEMVTVPRTALQALAEWAYPVFGWDRIYSKIPGKNPRTGRSDDLHLELQAERMAFLKGIFWKAHNEAARRERAMDPSKGFGDTPSLEQFSRVLSEMEDPAWDKPLSRREATRRRRAIRAGNEELAKAVEKLEHPDRDTRLRSMLRFGDCSLYLIEERLRDDDPGSKNEARKEISRMMGELTRLAEAS